MSKGREITILKTLKSEHLSMFYRSDGILALRFVEEYELDVADLKRIQDELDTLEIEHKLYILVVPGIHGNLTKEAREMPMFHKDHIASIGIVATHLHQRILGNLYFKFRKSSFENYKIFKDEEKSVRWLYEQMKANKDAFVS